MGKVPKSSKWNTAVKLHVNTRYYAQHQALKSVYGESQSVIVGKLVFSSRAIFELTQGILDSKTSDWNCSFEAVRSIDHLSRQGNWIIFMFSFIIISLRKVVTLQLYCDIGSLGRSSPLLPYFQYICCKYIIKDKENPHSEHINCFWVIKVEIFINLALFESFLEVPPAAL